MGTLNPGGSLQEGAGTPYFCYLRASGPDGVSAGANDALPFAGSVNDIDPYNMHDPVTNNTRITIARTGLYLLSGSAVRTVSVQLDTEACQLRIYIGGSTVHEGVQRADADDGTGNNTFNIPLRVKLLNAGDYIELKYNNTTASADHNIGVRSLLVLELLNIPTS
jgi:hypothetical protein